jgi:hypothetical protein
MDELVPYKLSVGSAFLVLGSATGRTEAIHQVEDKITHEKWCAFDDTTLEDLPELVARIPMNAVDCDIALPPTPTPMTETEVVGTMGKVWEGVSQAFLSETRPPVGRNPCFVREEYMVLVSGQPEATRERYVSAVFQNTELRFVLQRLEEPFTNAPQIRFEVHGGFAGQQVVTNDIGLTLPVRMVTGPVPSFRQSSPGQPNPLGIDGLPGPDMPYLYVIDQRVFLSTGRLGARGQLLRIHPRVSDVVPGIETPSSSNSYFPIQ